MRVAYADPPYPGLARLYKDHPDYDGEVEHATLLRLLTETFDAWALHTYSNALRELLPLCPETTRVLAWVKPWASWKKGVSPAYAWEPILIHGGRAREDATKVRDFLACHPATDWEFPGAKPRLVGRWVFAALGLEPDDLLIDLFPGSGAVSAAWEEYRAAPPIDLRVPKVSPDQIEIEIVLEDDGPTDVALEKGEP